MAKAKGTFNLILDINIPDELLNEEGEVSEDTEKMIEEVIKDSIRKALANKANPDREDLGIARILAVFACIRILE